MALLPLGESMWRLFRRALHKKTVTFTEVRNGTRHDREHVEWLVHHGFFVAVGEDRYELTDKGRAVADLGLYEV
jgi:hypothetical protein